MTLWHDLFDTDTGSGAVLGKVPPLEPLTGRVVSYAEAMRVQTQQGILDYCGIADAKIQILYGALDSAETRQSLLALSHKLGREF